VPLIGKLSRQVSKAEANYAGLRSPHGHQRHCQPHFPAHFARFNESIQMESQIVDNQTPVAALVTLLTTSLYRFASHDV